MNAFWALLPIILIRYALMGALDKAALKRAAHFPAMVGGEKIAYGFYQLSTLSLFLYPFFLKITFDRPMSYIGSAVYGIGIAVCIASTYNFTQTDKNGLTTKGLYRLSRHPMYIGYFLGF